MRDSSTVSNLFCIIRFFGNYFVKHSLVDVLYTVFYKAFDKLDFQILLGKFSTFRYESNLCTFLSGSVFFFFKGHLLSEGWHSLLLFSPSKLLTETAGCSYSCIITSVFQPGVTYSSYESLSRFLPLHNNSKHFISLHIWNVSQVLPFSPFNFKSLCVLLKHL